MGTKYLEYGIEVRQSNVRRLDIGEHSEGPSCREEEHRQE